MNYLFLRGHVPKDRNPGEIIFDKIEDCDDVWTQLFFNMVGKNDFGELLYFDGERNHNFSVNFCEKWVNQNYCPKFKPDVIFCRGGFVSYIKILNKFSSAFKIYYGAGARFLPTDGFYNYNLILVDSEEQLKIAKSKFPAIKCSLFIKPAADNIFFKKQNVEKEFDVVFPANGAQEDFKGHSFVFGLPKKFKILNLGNNGKIKPPDNVTRIRVLRKQISDFMQKAKIGIVCSNANIDSCPRVIPELIASGVPILCLDTTRFWKEKYITSDTGKIANKKDFISNLEYMIDNYEKYKPEVYYKNCLSIDVASKFIINMIKNRNSQIQGTTN